MENMGKRPSQISHRSLSMSAVGRLKLADEKKEAIDEGMIAMGAKTRAADAMTPPTKQELEAPESGQKILNSHNKQLKDLSKDEKSVGSGSKALSSFLALPIELHLQIILNLAHSIESGLLNRTYFRSPFSFRTKS